MSSSTQKTGWTNFWFLTGRTDSLAVFRIGFGLFVLAYWLLLPDVTYPLSAEGFYLPWSAYPEDGISSTRDLIGLLVGSPSRLQAWFCYLGLLVPLAGFIGGVWFRLSTFAYLILMLYHYFAYSHAIEAAYDNCMLLLTSILPISPCARTLSWDAFLDRIGGDTPAKSAKLWTQRLICVQLSIWYFGTGVHKVLDEAWSSGDIIYTSLLGPWGSPLGRWLAGLGLPMEAWDFVARFVVLFELLAAFLLFSPRWNSPSGPCGHLNSSKEDEIRREIVGCASSAQLDVVGAPHDR